MENTRIALEYQRSQVIIEHANWIAMMERQLDDMKFKITYIGEFKEEDIKVNDKVKIS